jgi:D-beta-D-heptose 7-phosphate kinase/D-beta-D-heptose 1-phosphate adenosyltransferase
MSIALSSLVASFAGRRLLVIGDAMLDSYLEGSSTRLCQEAPVPVVGVETRHDLPGGAANAAANAAALGARADLVAIVGDDAEAHLLRRALGERTVSPEHLVTDPGRRTLVKQRVVADSQLLVRFDQGDTKAPGRAVGLHLAARVERLWDQCDAVLISDYGYGVLTPELIACVARLQRRSPRLLVADAKNLHELNAVRPTAVKPNYLQVRALLGKVSEDARPRPLEVEAAAERLFELTGAHLVAVTMDSEGAVVIERGAAPYRTFARPQSDVRAAGAGDTFVTALTLALAAGAHSHEAAELASAAAAIVVGKERTAICDADELSRSFDAGAKYVGDRAELEKRIAFHRGQGRRIVFTNGCFDILHRGHITYLSRAKSLGDVLVVGLNSDTGVARLKGPTRPVNPLSDRIEVLAALSCVDHVTAFDEDTPECLIETLRPDVFVKGGDYTVEMLPEAPLVRALGGEVCILGYVRDVSTTAIVDRVRAADPSRDRHVEARVQAP